MQEQEMTMKSLIVRAVFGGLLMGMANLVPGISGGTMLLAVGIYSLFISSVAEMTTLRFSLRACTTLATVALSALLTILLGAGWIKDLVVDFRWIMYSLFIGLTLGGVPLVWRLAKPVDFSFWAGTGLGFIAMVFMALGGGASNSHNASYAQLFFSGLAGAGSMILPGVSGGYLLLLLGQYERILTAIDQVKQALQHGEMAPFVASLQVVVPVGLGVVVGVVGVSNLLKWLLQKYEKPTLGVLFGLLLGAVIGIWPFQQGRQPLVGELFQGKQLTAEMITALKPEKWPLDYFHPSLTQIVLALLLVLAGLTLTLGVERLGRSQD